MAVEPNLAQAIAKRCAQAKENEQNFRALVPGSDNCSLASGLAERLMAQYPDSQYRPPLYGKLLGVKDVFLSGNIPTRAGSLLPRSVFAGQAAIPVAQLINAGAILMAKTTCSEFNYISKPPTLNPRVRERSPGGSSTGSAAAVAAGICDLALGSQSRAGIMMPAAFCGILGFKPSSGRISRQGLISFSPTLEQPGILAREFDILHNAAKILLNKDQAEIDADTKPALGIPSQVFLAQADSEVLDHFEYLLGSLNAAGYRIRQLDAGNNYLKINQCHRDLYAAEFTQQLIPLIGKYGHLFSLATRELYETGLKVLPEKLYRARELQPQFREELQDEMNARAVTLLLSPSTATLPPLVSAEPISTALSLPFSFCGLPTLSVPIGNHPSGLPFGLQISAAWGWDEYLLQQAEQIWSALNR